MTEVMTCQTAVAGMNGTVTVPMDKGEPRVLFPTEYMKGSGLCGYARATNETTSSSPSGTGTPSGTASSATASSTKKGSAGRVHVPVVFAMGLLGVAAWILT